MQNMSVEIFNKSQASKARKQSKYEVQSKLHVQKKSAAELIASKKQALLKKSDDATNQRRSPLKRRSYKRSKSPLKAEWESPVAARNEKPDRDGVTESYDIELKVTKKASKTPRSDLKSRQRILPAGLNELKLQ